MTQVFLLISNRCSNVAQLVECRASYRKVVQTLSTPDVEDVAVSLEPSTKQPTRRPIYNL